jgi:hypothetical protein
MEGHYPADYTWSYCRDIVYPYAPQWQQHAYHIDFKAQNLGATGNYLSQADCEQYMLVIDDDCTHGGYLSPS